MTEQIDVPPSTRSDDSQFKKLGDEIRLRLQDPPWVLLVEIFIGIGWLRAAVEKIVDPLWWDGSELTGFLDSHAVLTLPWYQGFVDNVVAPNLLPISIIVVFAQLFVGIALISDWKLPAALATGLFLNLNFVAAGSVEPSIFYLVCQIALVLWILHDKNGVARRPLRVVGVTSLIVALSNVPFIWTLDPTWVIEDPAMALVTVGLLTSLAAFAGLRRPTQSTETDLPTEPESQVEVDLTTSHVVTTSGFGPSRVG